MPIVEYLPGLSGEVRGMYVGNDRFGDGVEIAPSHSRCVRFGSSQYPDHADPRYSGGDYQGGRLLTPDEADELAEYLLRAASWARAQNILDGISDAVAP